VIVGLVWGFLALQGAIGLVGFAAINAGLVIVKLLILIVDLFTLWLVLLFILFDWKVFNIIGDV